MKKIFTILSIVGVTVAAQAQQTFDYVAANQGFSNSQVMTTGTIIAGKLTYEALKNGSNNSPAYFNNGTNIRLYSQTTTGQGNSYEVKAATGVKINTVKIVTPGQLGNDNYAPTSAIISVDGVVVPTVYDPADASNATYLINAATPASSIKIQNGQTGASAQIRIVSINIMYSETSLAVADYTKFSASSFVKNTFVKTSEITFGSDAKDVKIYNMSGQIVKSASVKAGASVDVADLAKGNYIVTGTVNNQPVSQKILKD